MAKEDILKLAGVVSENFKTPMETYAYKAGYLSSMVKMAKEDLERALVSYNSWQQELYELKQEENSEVLHYTEQAFKELGESISKSLEKIKESLERAKSSNLDLKEIL